ncbi:uncharacterized protein LOC127706990 [Mytilus californianus]|uniref:uncharacterized protein LOC127706990 n=1 Tax=Mytilus californianus TaxID=6549 RepID=UPI0022465A1B|nr:uncharacterized protein LOC127706990 [Mytilus californianus]
MFLSYFLVLYTSVWNITHATTDTSSKVLIDVQEERLVFGQTVELVCHLQGSLHLEDGSSRQWSGGAFNKVLSLNGYSSDISKYQEIIKTNTEFRLRVLNFNESDANQYYKCVYGFKFNETKLDLTKKLYEYIPSESEIDTQFIVNNESEIVRTYVRFQKMYPVPQCVVYSDKSSVNMTIESKTIIGLFLNVSLNSEMKSAECCGREITIKCLVGTRVIIRRTMKIPECGDRNELVTLPDITVIVLPTVSILLVCLVSLVLVYKIKHKSDYSKSRTNEC